MTLMLALTLTQPWASCCVIRVPGDDLPPKLHETRSWTPVKGALPLELAIHAGKNCPRDVRDALVDAGHLIDPYRSIVEQLGFTTRDPWRKERGQQRDVDELPIAAVIGVVTVTKVYKTTGVAPKGLDGHLGDFSRGRYAWRMENAIALRRSVPCRGFQGLWELPTGVESQVRAQLAVSV